MIDVSIVIISFNTKKLLKNCLGSLVRNTKEVNYEIILVDNNSEDGSVEFIKSLNLKNFKPIFSKKNLGFGGGNNIGMKEAKGRYVLLLNSDTVIPEADPISQMVRWMDENHQAGAATCKLLNPNGSVQATGGKFPTLGMLFNWAFFLDDLPFVSELFGSYHPSTPNSLFASSYYKKPKEIDWATGAFLLLRREILAKKVFFDEKFFMYTEDVEYCFRIKKAGYRIFYVPNFEITHIGGGSSSGETVQFSDKTQGKERGLVGEFEGLKILYKKHYPDWQYTVLRIILKCAAALRYLLFGLVQGQSAAKTIYAKAFQIA